MTTMGMDAVELLEVIAEVTRLIKVVIIHLHLETDTGILEICIYKVSEVTGISLSGLDSTVTMKETEMDPETPYTGTETGGGAGGVGV